MTREEAIKKLQRHKAEYLDEWVDFSGIAEALDMAISALKNEHTEQNVGMCQQNVGEMSEKQTDEDLISRQAVINKISNTNFFLSNENWNELIKAIKDVPSEENTAEWIDREIYDADRWKCSKCGKTEQYREKYCPNCGCRMKGME